MSARLRMDDAPKVDVESPRIVAAMKVTGIDASDIHIDERKLLSEPESSNPRAQESQLRRQDLLERKRRTLIRELETTAAALDDGLVDTILSPSTSNTEFREHASSALEDEKRKIDSKRERVKSEMQKELEREMERKKAYENMKSGRTEKEKRKDQVRREERQNNSTVDDRTKREEKQEGTLNQIKKDDWTKRKETMQKIRETNDRITKMADDRTQEMAALSEERRKKMAEIAEKNLETQKVEEDEKMRKFNGLLEKQREREDRMDRMAREALHQKRSKFADKMTTVNDCMKTQQTERERVFKENTEKLERARQAGRERQAEVAEKTRSTRQKEMDKWTTNREANRKENRERMTKLKAEISDGHSKSVEVREKFLEETVHKKADMKSCLNELVEQNKARISRSEECKREQTLANIRHTKEKLEGNAQQKQQVIEYRTNALRDEMIGRTQLNELKMVVRDSGTKRINQLLKELDMPLLPTGKVKEEGEDDKKQ